MINLTAVNSAAGAGEYYSRDNYYSTSELTDGSQWMGRGAAELGLNGPVDQTRFIELLSGRLPNGTVIPAPQGEHRPGLDMTFSAPKSLSLLALVGRDERITGAFQESVAATLDWVQKNLIEARVWDPSTKMQAAERTGNLVAATFQHDLNRNGDPQLHVHALIINATLATDGKWHAVHNDQLYRNQHLIGAVHNADLRQRIEDLGYETVPAQNPIGGAFEVRGVGREAIQAFSTRRAEILNALAAESRGGTPRERELAALSTRQGKNPEFTPANRLEEWRETASRVGFEPSTVIEAAAVRASRTETIWSRAMTGVRGIGQQGLAIAAAMGVTPRDGDELVPERFGHLEPRAFAAAQAVASAARELGEREAAFSRYDLIRASLERRGPFRVEDVEARIRHLHDQGLLLGSDRLMTTTSALKLEQRVIAAAKEGSGKALPIADGPELAARVQAVARQIGLRRLNPGQEQAAVNQLTSTDRVELVQGGAGVGKSASLIPIAEIVRQEGRHVIALAHAGRTARDFGHKVGERGQTVDSFLGRHRSALEGRAGPDRMARARSELSGAVIMVDEASQIGNDRLLRLVELSNKLGVGRLILAGDIRQLPAIEAGKPFELLQNAGLPTSEITENLRATSPQMQSLNAALAETNISRAFEILKPDTVEVPIGAAPLVAARLWAKLPEHERGETLLLASGRAMRSAANAAVQRERIKNGELGSETVRLTTDDRVSITREGARHMKGYVEGRIVEFRTNLPSQTFSRGDRGVVEKVGDGSISLRMRDGASRRFTPGRLPRNLAHDAVSIFQSKEIELHAGDRIRWTETDAAKRLRNGDIAQVDRVGDGRVEVTTAAGEKLQFRHDDPILKKIDLAYAVNVHVAQGMTARNGIVLMSERERTLNSTRTFLVAVTRIAQTATLIVDSARALERAIARNEGAKLSATETQQKKGFEREPLLERGRGGGGRVLDFGR